MYDVNLTGSKALIGQAPVSDVKVTSHVQHLHSRLGRKKKKLFGCPPPPAPNF